MATDNSTASAGRGAWLDVLKSIWYFLGPNRKKYVFFNSVLFAVLFYELVPPLIVGKVVDFFSHYKEGDSLHTFYFYAIFLGAAHLVISAIRLTSKIKLTRIAIAAKTDARVKGFERLMALSLQWHAKENSGNKMQRIFTGSDSIPEWAYLVHNLIFPVTTNFIGVLAIFLFLNPVFLLFLIVYMTTFFTIEAIFTRRLKEVSTQVNQIREMSSGRYIEGAGNILAIKALGAEKDVNERMSGSELTFKNIQIVMANTGTKKWHYFQVLNGVSTTAFMLLIGYQYLNHLISVGDILVYFTYFRSLRESTGQATDISSKVIQLRSDLLRMMPIFLDPITMRAGKDKFPETWEEIAVENGGFKYPNSLAGIKDMNFSFRNGEKVGIAGPSGSGKSTFVKILLGLYELEEGTFKIGDKDYYEVSHDEVMKNFAIVLQETELFNLSFVENLTLGRNVDPELIKTAIEIACLQDVIDRLPQGLATTIGERGYALSGGERQRIGIARAICKNAPVILLDEATSALDSRTEKKIMRGLLSTGKEKTFIIIAHRIPTLKETDRVVIFDRGNIVEEGVYSELIADKDSHLGQLYALQSEG